MVRHGKDGYKKKVAHVPTQALGRRFLIVGISPFLGYQQFYQQGPQVGNQHTGGRMKAGLVTETIQGEAQQKSQEHLPFAANIKGHPNDEQEIKVGCGQLVQQHLVQHIILYQDKKHKADDIFYQCTHLIALAQFFGRLLKDGFYFFFFDIFYHIHVLQIVKIGRGSYCDFKIVVAFFGYHLGHGAHH